MIKLIGALKRCPILMTNTTHYFPFPSKIWRAWTPSKRHDSDLLHSCLRSILVLSILTVRKKAKKKKNYTPSQDTYLWIKSIIPSCCHQHFSCSSQCSCTAFHLGKRESDRRLGKVLKEFKTALSNNTSFHKGFRSFVKETDSLLLSKWFIFRESGLCQYSEQRQ